MRYLSPLLAAVVLAGCATRPVTVPAPAPERAPAMRSSGPSAAESDYSASTVIPAGSAGAPARLAAASPDSPRWDLDVRSFETNERVAHYVDYFTGRAKARIAERLQRGTRFEPMIRAKLREGGLPEDMYYLGLVESGFDNHAYSRAAAVGMWQFMTGTGRDAGLRIDPWVDERRDPVRSTSAFVRFIKELRGQFGSLYLAAAAYNGGPNRVARGLAMYAAEVPNPRSDSAFFVLADRDYLRNETREYVPQLIAAALIAKQPVRYGMELADLPAFSYDSVQVPGSTPVAAIARAAGATPAAILDLNPQLLRGMTPPREAYLVRVPMGAGEGFRAALDALPELARKATRVVESKKGDTVGGLAEAYGVPAPLIESFNPGLRRAKKSGRLVPGQQILLPTSAVASAALNVPDPAIERYPGATATAKKVEAAERVAPRKVARPRKASPKKRSGASSKAGARPKTSKSKATRPRRGRGSRA